VIVIDLRKVGREGRQKDEGCVSLASLATRLPRHVQVNQHIYLFGCHALAKLVLTKFLFGC
jgi:hypothetical protein